MERGKSIDLFLMDETRVKKNNTAIMNSRTTKNMANELHSL